MTKATYRRKNLLGAYFSESEFLTMLVGGMVADRQLEQQLSFHPYLK